MSKAEDDFIAAKKNLGQWLHQEQHSVHLKTGQFTYDDSLLEKSDEKLHHLQEELHDRRRDIQLCNQEDAFATYDNIIEDIYSL